MVQTVKSQTVYTGWKVILLEKPLASRRVFFSIKTLVDPTAWCRSMISFDDPSFSSHYVFDGPVQHFEARGEGIFQGVVWAHNVSPVDLIFVMTEILV